MRWRSAISRRISTDASIGVGPRFAHLQSATAGRPNADFSSTTGGLQRSNDRLSVGACARRHFLLKPPHGAEWTSTYDSSWISNFGEPHLAFAPLFGHQYCQTWIDFRGFKDAYMSRRGIDYFENNRRAIYAQRAYAIANPWAWKDYGIDVWGVTASDGPADIEREYQGKLGFFVAMRRAELEARTPTTTARWRPQQCSHPSHSRLR